MKISQISWRHYRGLADGAISPKGDCVTISGKNGTGKTSVASILPFVLFGKDISTVKQFENGLIPTNDGLIHGAEIIFNDGTKFRREYFWTDQGNRQNLFIDGKKVSSTNFKARVEMLTNGGGELLFNPFAFCQLKKDSQRDMLTRIFGELSEQDLLKQPSFKPIAEMLSGLTVDVFIARSKAELARAKSDLNTIDPIISELMNQLEELPKESLSQLEKSLSDLKLRRKKILSSTATKNLTDKIADLREERGRLQTTQADIGSDLQKFLQRSADLKNQQIFFTKQLTTCKTRREELLEEYRKLQSAKSGSCPTCGQRMPTDLFERQRKRNLQGIISRGKAAAEDLLEWQKSLEDLQRSLTEIHEQIDKLQSRSKSLDADKKRRRLKEIDQELLIANEELRRAQEYEETDREKNLSELDQKSYELTEKITRLKSVQEIKNRINYQRKRSDELQTTIAQLEDKINLARDFQHEHIEQMEESINKNFEHVRFKLFDYLITTGEVKPTCEAMLNGVPYSSLSKGEQLKASLDIFKSLQKFFKVEMPIFLDDAESYTENSLVELPNQKFFFRVAESELTIDG